MSPLDLFKECNYLSLCYFISPSTKIIQLFDLTKGLEDCFLGYVCKHNSTIFNANGQSLLVKTSIHTRAHAQTLLFVAETWWNLDR